MSCLPTFLCFCIFLLLILNLLFEMQGRPRRLKFLYQQESRVTGVLSFRRHCRVLLGFRRIAGSYGRSTFLSFWGISILFSTVVVSIYNLTNSTWGFFSLHPCQHLLSPVFLVGFPSGSDSKESACNAGDPGSIPGLGRSPEEREWLPTPFLPGESHGQRSLTGYSTWGCK